MRSNLLLTAILGIAVSACSGAGGSSSPPAGTTTLQFVVTSDAHYGITRARFRGRTNVDAHDVNLALVAAINTVPTGTFPQDGGRRAGEAVGPIDFIVEAGDMANRQEDNDTDHVQGASASWAQFVDDYVNGLHLRNGAGQATPLFLLPGNHEASNAIGYYEHMTPATDPVPLIDIRNRMQADARPLTPSTFNYSRDRVFYTRDIAGVHLVFLHVWPDSAMRARMDSDLATVPRTTPVLVFAHDQPDVQSKHLTNPHGRHDINATDKFENLLSDTFASGASVESPSVLEQGELERFLARHPNVTAYFHGNSNWHQVYDWNGPSHSVRLHTVRVDSPMKGAVSADDESRLSFAVVTMDLAARVMTVRECLWNAQAATGLEWGEATTVTLSPRPGRPAP